MYQSLIIVVIAMFFLILQRGRWLQASCVDESESGRIWYSNTKHFGSTTEGVLKWLALKRKGIINAKTIEGFSISAYKLVSPFPFFLLSVLFKHFHSFVILVCPSAFLCQTRKMKLKSQRRIQLPLHSLLTVPFLNRRYRSFSFFPQNIGLTVRNALLFKLFFSWFVIKPRVLKTYISIKRLAAKWTEWIMQILLKAENSAWIDS